jgi:hypothetical protein
MVLDRKVFVLFGQFAQFPRRGLDPFKDQVIEFRDLRVVSHRIATFQIVISGHHACAVEFSTTSGNRYTIVLNHRIRQKLVAHGLEISLGLGLVAFESSTSKTLPCRTAPTPPKPNRTVHVRSPCLAGRARVLEGYGNAGLDHAGHAPA